MKKLLLALSLAFISPIVYAQTNVAYSEAFDEPEDGWNKVLQIKNGNTFFLHFTKKDGIDVVVYDKAHKVISQKNLTSEVWDARRMRESAIEGVYEINGCPVLFLKQMKDKTPLLFRIILSPNDGSITGEKQIATLTRYKAGSSWAMAYGKVEPADFFVEKDKNSDCYAVINFNSFAHESDERIEVIHYGIKEGKHKILNRSFYDAQSFKYVRYIGMVVNGEESLFLCSYGYNTEKSGGKDSRVIVSRLKAGEKAFTNKLLEFTDDFKETKAVMEINPGTGMIQLLTLTLMQSKQKMLSSKTTNYYLSAISYIDPESLYIVTSKQLMGEKIVEYIRRNMKTEKPFSALPQHMIINKDNSTTILFEEMATQTTVNSGGQVVSAQTFLGSIGVSELDTKGQEQEGYAVVKSQVANGIIDGMYLTKKSKGLWSYRAGNPFVLENNAFMSFDYIDAGKNHYFLFNDYLDNYHAEETSLKRKPVTTISDANTICYKIKDGKIEKSFLFGAPKKDNEARFCYVESSHYLPEQNMYATLLIDRAGKKKQAKIAWVKFN